MSRLQDRNGVRSLPLLLLLSLLLLFHTPARIARAYLACRETLTVSSPGSFGSG